MLRQKTPLRAKTTLRAKTGLHVNTTLKAKSRLQSSARLKSYDYKKTVEDNTLGMAFPKFLGCGISPSSTTARETPAKSAGQDAMGTSRTTSFPVGRAARTSKKI